jgi:hypothetical protein
VRKRLRHAYFSTAAKNILIYGELCRILDALDREVPEPGGARSRTVVLKGADLALSVYPDFSLRPMADLDILVPRESLDTAVRVLENLGFRMALPGLASGRDRVRRNDVSMIGGPRGSVLVEVHWGLIASDMDRRSPTLDWFWQRVEELGYRKGGEIPSEAGDGARASVPASFCHFQPTANLLYLAAHIGVQHGQDPPKLLWYYDLHALISRFGDSIDWNAVLEKANELTWSAALSAVLERTRDHFGTSIPDECFEMSAVHTKIDEPLEVNYDQPKGSRLWNDMMYLPWSGRFRFACSHFFPSPAYMRWRYEPHPKWLWPLCYSYRWWIIVSEGMKALGHRVIRIGALRQERSIARSGHDDRIARALKEVASEQPLRLRVNGDCMAPLACDGDTVEVSRAGLLLPGDVIAFRQNGQVKLHRFLGYRPFPKRLALVTQGDHNSACDAHSDLSDVIGRVSGGGRSPYLVKVPLRHRIWALSRFFKLVYERLART